MLHSTATLSLSLADSKRHRRVSYAVATMRLFARRHCWPWCSIRCGTTTASRASSTHWRLLYAAPVCMRARSQTAPHLIPYTMPSRQIVPVFRQCLSHTSPAAAGTALSDANQCLNLCHTMLVKYITVQQVSDGKPSCPIPPRALVAAIYGHFAELVDLKTRVWHRYQESRTIHRSSVC